MNKFKIAIFSFAIVAIAAVSATVAHAAIKMAPAEQYNPQVNSADFTTVIDNPYFSLPIGKMMVYEAKTKDGVERIEILIPGWTRTVAGVETLVFWDRVYLNDELVEDTRDYIAQHKQTGDVWYFGEHVDNYENGNIKDHDGAWLTGVDGAKAGIWAFANPQVGDEYRNEYLKGQAEDESKVVSVNESASVPFGDFKSCIKTLDGTPLETAKAYKVYCKEVGGTVLEIGMPNYPKESEQKSVELVEVDKSGARDMAEVPAAYAREGVVGPSARPTSESVTCQASRGATIQMPTTYLYIEHNTTAGDTGVHGMFDSSTFAELCVYDPSGKQILAIKPQNQLGKLTMAGIFFESREPPHEDVSVEEHLRNFPEGKYAIRGVTYDGIGYYGAATFTHNIPKPPKMIFPKEMVDEADIKSQIITPKNVVIKWQPVNETIFGKPVTIKAYEVIVRSLLPDDPHGFSHDNFDVHMPSSATNLKIPDEFWKPKTPYEFEVLAIEESGNQTIVSGFFETSGKTGSLSKGLFGEDEDDDGQENGDEKEDDKLGLIVSGLIGLAFGFGVLLQKFVLGRHNPKV